MPDRGTFRKTTKPEELVSELLKTNPMLSCRMGQVKLRKKGVRLSLGAIRVRLREIHVEFRSVLKKPLLTEK